MIYSFTSPQPKSIISRLTKIWLFYMFLSVVIVYAFGAYLTMHRAILKSQINITETNIDTQDEQSHKTQANINRLNEEIALNEANNIYNEELRGALTKLFALIPDQITITQITLEEKRLTLKGITPSRETYSFLLQAPLRAVFTTSRVDFFPLTNGWYNFTSISTLSEDEP